MGNNHSAFIETYQATRTQKAKKLLLKSYMLGLSSEELDSFIMGTFDQLEHHIKADLDANTLSDIDKQTIISDLSDMSNVLTTKQRRLKAA